MLAVRPHTRRKPARPYAAEREAMTARLWGEVVHRQCVEALERVFAEPLDATDMPADQRDRIRETW